MTRIAVLADIHSNLPALDAVCARIDALDCQEIFCLGDIVGYGTAPSACIQIVQQRNMVCVQGNHDACVAEEGCGGDYSFNYAAIMSVNHNREQLSTEEILFLKELPISLAWDERTLLVHGSPEDRDRYIRYDVDMRELSASLLASQGPGILFLSHTHTSFVHDGREPQRDANGVYFIDHDSRMLCNPGSVGQPRDGDPRAAFMVWDVDESTVTQYRLEYDIEKARADIIAAGLPHQLGDRLLRGR